jgi:hypothetical protein
VFAPSQPSVKMHPKIFSIFCLGEVVVIQMDRRAGLFPGGIMNWK